MNMEVVAPEKTARAIRERLMNPPGGRMSTEIEVVSDRHLKRLEREQALLRAQIAKQKQLEAAIAAMAASIEQEREQWQQTQNAWTAMMANRGVFGTRIMTACCDHFKVDPLFVLGKSRQATICYVRHIIVYLCCDMTKKSLGEVGRFLGGRDHSTALHSRDKIAGLLAAGDPELTADIAAIKKLLGVA